jgi:hypothetical protein
MTCSATWLYKRWANPMDSPGSAVLNGGHHCHHPLRKTQVLTYPSLHHLQIQYVSKSKSQRLELNPVQLLHLCTSMYILHVIFQPCHPQAPATRDLGTSGCASVGWTWAPGRQRYNAWGRPWRDCQGPWRPRRRKRKCRAHVPWVFDSSTAGIPYTVHMHNIYI